MHREEQILPMTRSTLEVYVLGIKPFHVHETFISHGTYMTYLFADDSSYKTNPANDTEHTRCC